MDLPYPFASREVEMLEPIPNLFVTPEAKAEPHLDFARPEGLRGEWIGGSES
jgi:hypothetical protein